VFRENGGIFPGSAGRKEQFHFRDRLDFEKIFDEGIPDVDSAGGELHRLFPEIKPETAVLAFFPLRWIRKYRVPEFEQCFRVIVRTAAGTWKQGTEVFLTRFRLCRAVPDRC